MLLSQSQLVVLACILALVLAVVAQAAAKLKHRSLHKDYQLYNKVKANMAAFKDRYSQVPRLVGLSNAPDDMLLAVFVEVALELSLYVIPLALLQATFLGISARKLLAPATAADRTQGAVGVGYIVATTLADAATHDVVRLLFDLAAIRARGEDLVDFFDSL